MSQTTRTVLIVDDNPEHLKIYSWLVQQAGYAAVPCLVRRSGPEFRPDTPADLVLLDYVLSCEMETHEVAHRIRETWPEIPIVLLSDQYGVPQEMENRITCFVRKGQPAKLTAMVHALLGAPDEHVPEP